MSVKSRLTPTKALKLLREMKLVTEKAAMILQAAQIEQDRGHPWGAALDAAEEKAAELGVKA